MVIGNAQHGSTLTLEPSLFNQGKSLLGTWGGDSVPDRDYAASPACWPRRASPCAACCQALQAQRSDAGADRILPTGRVGRPLIDMAA